MADCLDARVAERHQAEMAVSDALMQLTGSGRTPDAWERVHLARAISCLFRGMYESGTIEAELALSAEAERSPQALLPSESALGRLSTAELLKASGAFKREPTRQFPHFGSIVATSALAVRN